MGKRRAEAPQLLVMEEQGRGTWWHLSKKKIVIGGGAVVCGTAAIALCPVALAAVGFTSAGVGAGTLAASAQSVIYGGATTGIFSILQAAGAGGLSTGVSAALGGASGAAGGAVASVAYEVTERLQNKRSAETSDTTSSVDFQLTLPSSGIVTLPSSGIVTLPSSGIVTLPPVEEIHEVGVQACEEEATNEEHTSSSSSEHHGSTWQGAQARHTCQLVRIPHRIGGLLQLSEACPGNWEEFDGQLCSMLDCNDVLKVPLSQKCVRGKCSRISIGQLLEKARYLNEETMCKIVLPAEAAHLLAQVLRYSIPSKLIEGASGRLLRDKPLLFYAKLARMYEGSDDAHDMQTLVLRKHERRLKNKQCHLCSPAT